MKSVYIRPGLCLNAPRADRLMLQMVPADELNASIAYSEEWKALEDHVSKIEKT